MPVYSYDGVLPAVAASAYVHPDAVLIGHVHLGPEASVWPTAVLRGDHGEIRIGARTSVQDGTIVHTTAQWPTVVGADCVVGHNAHLEGCVVEDGCLIASGSLVLNRARIGRGSVVAAAALVAEGTEVPPDSMVVGVPGRIRPLDPARHGERIEYGVRMYVDNARHYPRLQRLVDLESCRLPAGS